MALPVVQSLLLDGNSSARTKGTTYGGRLMNNQFMIGYYDSLCRAGPQEAGVIIGPTAKWIFTTGPGRSPLIIFNSHT